ncbi:hypothetical protein [Streptomyces litchfieldiae]|uniref:Uncharacterized protein n=1 Tax=Streptomyces litchfieldiae TaxID=3075543 RepID=A0ABU2MJK2_9ACTN|nr:hypothetical protein [Streptomyces sp. DSM 44938]MDT0341764.1 hypothetical protein [Streptomyces sp. DSM 44938]
MAARTGEFRVALADGRVRDEAEGGQPEAASEAEETTGDEAGAKPEAETAKPPKSYRMITPTDWFRVPLRSEEKRLKSVRALVDHAYPNRDEFATKRHELRDLLTNVMNTAAERGAIEIYLSTHATLGVPIPASLLVTAEPEDPSLPGPMPAELLADGLRSKHKNDADVSIVKLLSGEAVRCRRQELSEDSKELGQPQERPNTLLEFYLPVPNSTAWLVLTFSAPLPELADAQVQMFDAIAGSFRWS